MGRNSECKGRSPGTPWVGCAGHSGVRALTQPLHPGCHGRSCCLVLMSSGELPSSHVGTEHSYLSGGREGVEPQLAVIKHPAPVRDGQDINSRRESMTLRTQTPRKRDRVTSAG